RPAPAAPADGFWVDGTLFRLEPAQRHIDPVGALLAHLPAAQRLLLLLRLVRGLDAEHTGYVLDMSPGAVRVAQHRALVRLRALALESRTGELGALGPGHRRSQ